VLGTKIEKIDKLSRKPDWKVGVETYYISLGMI